MYQYAVYTQDSKFQEVFDWISANRIKHELHLNRTRFWLTEGPLMTEFLLKYRSTCPRVEGDEYALR